MARGAAGHIKALRRRDGNLCHYCRKSCNLIMGSPRQATKDHIVPRYFLGKNTLDNYVLACAKCNSNRGNLLSACTCSICAPRIAEALDNQVNIDYVFGGLIAYNRPRIYKVKNERPRIDDGRILPWKVWHGTGVKHFETYTEAVKFATGDIQIRSHNDRF